MIDPKFGPIILAAVSRMIIALGGRKLGDLTGEAKGEAYMIALDDVPYWAVTMAERKWYRGEYGKDNDYSFPPSPARFRELARGEQCSVLYQGSRLRILLEAVEEDSR